MPNTNKKPLLIPTNSTSISVYFPRPPLISSYSQSTEEEKGAHCLFAYWKITNCCLPTNFPCLPLWKKNPLKSVRWSATVFDTCLWPTQCYDRFVYKICCCGNENTNCWDCDGALLLNAAAFTLTIPFLLHLPKLPCCICSGICTCAAAVAGGCFDLVQSGTFSGPKPQVMDDEISLIKNEYFESKVAITSQINTQVSNAQTLDQLLDTVNDLLDSDNLPKVMEFFSDLNNFELMQRHRRMYEKKIYVICLTIRYVAQSPETDIDLETRKVFLTRLLDKNVIDGYDSHQGWVQAPLVEAVRSHYRHSAELLELLCQMGATVRLYCIGAEQHGHMPPFLQLRVYHDLLFKQHETDLFYKALLLKYYDRPSSYYEFGSRRKAGYEEKFQSYLRSHESFAELDQRLDELAEKRVDRGLQRNVITRELQSEDMTGEIVSIIGQYCGIFSPPIAKVNSHINIRSMAKLLVTHSSLFEFPEVEEDQAGYGSFLSNNQNLPPYRSRPIPDDTFMYLGYVFS